MDDLSCGYLSLGNGARADTAAWTPCARAQLTQTWMRQPKRSDRCADLA